MGLPTSYVRTVFLEKTPASVTREIDDLIVGQSKLPHSKSVVGTQWIAMLSPRLSVRSGLNELTGVGGPIGEGSFGISPQQRHDNFLARINIDLVSGRDGQSLRGFMLPFSGTASEHLWWGGPFVAYSLPPPPSRR